ncbi:MAG: Na+/H+ antiporter subunit E [Gammaproteobacteria bacterium]|jgi:multisubunit Na+/H+ antiporter MnhE subunit
MSRMRALAVLLWHFARALVLSSWATARLILFEPDAPRRGFARLEYGDLSESGAVLLAALVTLTPGTSTVDIDTERRELLLHVLDGADLDATLAGIRRDFLQPIRRLLGGDRR